MERDGYACARKQGETSELLLVAFPDGTYDVYCRACIMKEDWEHWMQDTHFYRIGDDVTGDYL
jgi:hypothetical protein